MRYLVKRLVAGSLALIAHLIVRKYRPKVVMVTGSVGKTSTKDALAAALSSRFYLRAPDKSFNNEFGVPFTVLGVRHYAGFKSIKWLGIFKEALALLVLPNHYPNLLVLEVGADRPGDMRRILEIATPDMVVVTCLPDVPVHVEAYATPAAVREEEFMPAYALLPAAPLIVNASDLHALQMAKRVPAALTTFGEGEADIAISKIGFYTEKGRVAGMKAKVKSKRGEGELIVKGSVGYQQVLPAAAALGAADALGVGQEEALKALEGYVPPPGRGRLFGGVNGSQLIDDTYNSSPAASEEALKTLKEFPKAKRRIAILGDMLELGRYSASEHERIGKVADDAADLVIGVGIRARAMDGAQSFDDSSTAAREIRSLVQEGDVVLIKGSQSIRMERVVEALLEDPKDAARLVRQDPEWKRLT